MSETDPPAPEPGPQPDSAPTPAGPGADPAVDDAEQARVALEGCLVLLLVIGGLLAFPPAFLVVDRLAGPFEAAASWARATLAVAFFGSVAVSAGAWYLGPRAALTAATVAFAAGGVQVAVLCASYPDAASSWPLRLGGAASGLVAGLAGVRLVLAAARASGGGSSALVALGVAGLTGVAGALTSAVGRAALGAVAADGASATRLEVGLVAAGLPLAAGAIAAAVTGGAREEPAPGSSPVPVRVELRIAATGLVVLAAVGSFRAVEAGAGIVGPW